MNKLEKFGPEEEKIVRHVKIRKKNRQLYSNLKITKILWTITHKYI